MKDYVHSNSNEISLVGREAILDLYSRQAGQDCRKLQNSLRSQQFLRLLFNPITPSPRASFLHQSTIYLWLSFHLARWPTSISGSGQTV